MLSRSKQRLEVLGSTRQHSTVLSTAQWHSAQLNNAQQNLLELNRGQILFSPDLPQIWKEWPFLEVINTFLVKPGKSDL
jgi:hypothetical protein